jgi:hypothetical protein
VEAAVGEAAHLGVAALLAGVAAEGFKQAPSGHRQFVQCRGKCMLPTAGVLRMLLLVNWVNKDLVLVSSAQIAWATR